MSERKVLTKYYPPDFDPNALTRKRGPKQQGPKVQVVRLMSPFSMKCMSCGEYIYKGRKFNARKETRVDDKYLSIQVHRFYLRCTRCSAEIIFKTDPKNNDYSVVSGAKRNTEPWRQAVEESDEQRLDRLEAEEEEAEKDMKDLEAKVVDAKREMEVADALDEIRKRNARLQRADREGAEYSVARPEDEEQARQDEEDAEAAKAAFASAKQQEEMEELITEVEDSSLDTTASNADGHTATLAAAPVALVVSKEDPPPPSFKKQVKKKKDYSAALGIKKKQAML